jgi:UDP-glucuronate 4-epimerase
MALYLITGAAGFIGSRVSMLLLQQGHQVIGVDDLNDSYDVRLKQHRLHALDEYRWFRLLQLNVADTAQVEEGLRSVDTPVAVLNLAARSGVRQSVTAPCACLHTNVIGTINLLDFCRRRGVKKFVLASSSSVYGAQGSMPYSEDCETKRSAIPTTTSMD